MDASRRDARRQWTDRHPLAATGFIAAAPSTIFGVLFVLVAGPHVLWFPLAMFVGFWAWLYVVFTRHLRGRPPRDGPAGR